MNDANQEKLRLMRWILPQLDDDQILAAELSFRDVSRKADLVIVGPNRLAAVEVKGPRDNLDKIQSQVADYLKSFLEVDVALSSRFIKIAKDALPPSVGIIELGNEHVIRRRKAARRSRLAAGEAVQWLRSSDLRKLLGIEARTLDIGAARDLAVASCTSVELTEKAIEVANQRARDRYEMFLSERGEKLTLDDIATLQSPTKVR